MIIHSHSATSSAQKYNSGNSFSLETIHRIRKRIQLQIPSQYAQEPLISTLVHRYEVEVNILSALLATNSQESGWFDLELRATPSRIQNALAYLSGLRVEIWTDYVPTKEPLSFS